MVDQYDNSRTQSMGFDLKKEQEADEEINFGPRGAY